MSFGINPYRMSLAFSVMFFGFITDCSDTNKPWFGLKSKANGLSGL